MVWQWFGCTGCCIWPTAVPNSLFPWASTVRNLIFPSGSFIMVGTVLYPSKPKGIGTPDAEAGRFRIKVSFSMKLFILGDENQAANLLAPALNQGRHLFS